MNGAQKALLFFGVLVLIGSMWSIYNSYKSVSDAEKEVEAACVDAKAALTELKKSIDEFDATGGETTYMKIDFNSRVINYNENCVKK